MGGESSSFFLREGKCFDEIRLLPGGSTQVPCIGETNHALYRRRCGSKQDRQLLDVPMHWRVSGFGVFFPSEWSTPQVLHGRAMPKFDSPMIGNETGLVSDRLGGGKALKWWGVCLQPKRGRSFEKKATALGYVVPRELRKPPSTGHVSRDPIDGQDVVLNRHSTQEVLACFLVEACKSWSCVIFHDTKCQLVS